MYIFQGSRELGRHSSVRQNCIICFCGQDRHRMESDDSKKSECKQTPAGLVIVKAKEEEKLTRMIRGIVRIVEQHR